MYELDVAMLPMLSAAVSVVWQLVQAGLGLLLAALVLYASVAIMATAYYNALFHHILKLEAHYKGTKPNV